MTLKNKTINRKVQIGKDNYSIFVTNAPPIVNNTNTETKSGFVLFFYNEYFGIKVETNMQKKAK